MRILVTGANGYIGSKVVKCLCDNDVEVVATDISNQNIDNRAKFIAANIFEPKDNWFEFFGEPDICLHMAWRDGFVHNSDKHMLDLPNHFVFVKNLMDNGLKQIACMGSMHEVGYWEGAIDENTPCNPQSLYGIAKNALRQSMQLYAAKVNCKFQWLRAYYIYGDDQYGNSIFCKIRQAVKEGKKTFPFTSGKNKYDFIHIDVLAKQIYRSITQDKILGIINCCSGKPISLSEQVEWYISSNKLPIKLEYGKFPDRPYDSPCVYGDNKKIKEIMSNKIVVTGANGQLGSDLVRELTKRGFQVFGLDISDMDITDKTQVTKVLYKIMPSSVIHCAAWTAVDSAEDENNISKVKAINADGTKNIAEVCKQIDAKMMYISTDYVFDGQGEKPWEPDFHNFKPLNVYGKTKLMGELAVASNLDKYFIVRIAWAFGVNGKNFIKTMLNVGKTHDTVRVVNDQIGTPTYTFDLARLLVDMIETDKYGYYHATNEGGYISWYDFTKEIYRQAGYKTEVIPVSTQEYGLSKAARPFNSRLDKSKLVENGFKPLPTWQDALARYLKEIDY